MKENANCELFRQNLPKLRQLGKLNSPIEKNVIITVDLN
jgi:hypothetical protein